MRSIVAILAVVSLCQARPQVGFIKDVRPSFMFGGDQYIIGGTDAAPGEFPWQLSQQRGGSHSCGASLLGPTSALSAGHCVDGALAGNLNVIAGLYRRSDLSGTQESGVSSYTIHEEYGAGLPTYSNDIAILHLSSTITIGGDIQAATLPADNGDQYVGLTCVISGWGRTSSSNILPDVLQKASIGVIDTAECQSLVDNVIGARIWEGHICLYDSANNIGSCNGDSGGPLNCPDGGTVVAGVTSWGVSSGGDCLQTYPSVYTRTSYYLGWIEANTP